MWSSQEIRNFFLHLAPSLLLRRRRQVRATATVMVPWRAPTTVGQSAV